jgi:putative copper resistance protein D
LFTLESSVAAVTYLVLALLVGFLVTSVFLLARYKPTVFCRRLAYIPLALVCAFLILHFASLVVQGAKLSGGEFPAADVITRYILRTQSGQIWLVRMLYALLFLVLAVGFARRGTGTLVLLLLSLPLVASRSLTGHAVAVRDNTLWIVAADAVHLIATACWAGVLPFLFYLLGSGFRSATEYPDLAVTAVKQFSRLAFACVSILVATGAYQSWTHVGRLDALTSTAYGNVLAVKLVIFVCMLTLGAINFFSTRPTLLRATGSSLPPKFETTALRRVGVESLLGVAILLLSGFLTGLPPAVHSTHATTVPRAGSQGAHDHKAHGAGSAAGRFKPAEGVSVEIVSPKPGQTYNDDKVPIQFKLTEEEKRGHYHVHAYVDNQLMGMFQSENGVLTGIAPGKHVLTLRVVEADHTTELDVADEVVFVVTPARPEEKGP